MPEQETLDRARRDKLAGKSASTQAGAFVREEIHHVRAGKHGARSTKQVIAIGLSKARRAGVALPAPNPSTTSARTRQQAARDTAIGQLGTGQKPSPSRSRAARVRLKREGSAAARPEALARQARASARKRTAQQRSAAAARAVRTKGRSGRSAAVRKAARTSGRA